MTTWTKNTGEQPQCEWVEILFACYPVDAAFPSHGIRVRPELVNWKNDQKAEIQWYRVVK